MQTLNIFQSGFWTDWMRYLMKLTAYPYGITKQQAAMNVYEINLKGHLNVIQLVLMDDLFPTGDENIHQKIDLDIFFSSG